MTAHLSFNLAFISFEKIPKAPEINKRDICNAKSSKELKFSKTSVAQTGLGQCKLVPVNGSSSQPE